METPHEPVSGCRRLWLIRLLWWLGLADMLAIVVVALPTEWIATVHRLIGLGEMPGDRLTVYLARSTSMIYAFLGAIIFAVSRDVDRYRPLIRLIAWLAIAAGALLLLVDINVGMPVWWTLLEGPVVASLGISVIRLSR